MTDRDLNEEWAWAQVEAMADGSLERVEARRMRAAMRADPALAAAVEDAARLTRELERLRREPVPRGLARRLLAIPGSPARRSPWAAWGVPAAAAATGAVVALAGLLALEQISRPQPARELAVAEFGLAMSYLQRSAEMTGDDVTREVAEGLRDALAVSRSAVLERQSQNGDSDDQE